MGQFSMEISGCAGSALSGNQHIGFKKTDFGNTIEVEREGIAYGWLPSDVLTDVFDMNSSRPPELTRAVNRALELLKLDNTSTKELRGIARNVQVLRRSLPPHDPLNPVLNAIESIAFPAEADSDLRATDPAK
ncbi:hypothetical protein CPT32_28755 [Rhizobium sophoriradicis]|uniref:hypothetical protein n=1 Tax=Rhizobium sophoriradicis TaxID=1535245 RepID=UPI000BBD7352|nr:hypothetical protein [Rhizobium sophoriradicis]PCK83562.1 hypothetical protein CPT32_28755 [Rhizobium sophoriradicis]